MLKILNPERYSSPKIISLEQAVNKVISAKAEGLTVGLCHGGFDLLHPGHLTHFESAKKKCDLLVVSVTSDRFVSVRKGGGRPVFPEKLRAYAVAALAWVDYVVVTEFKKGVEVINALKPSFYIKGPDMIGKMTPGIISEREAISRVGGKMVYTKDPKLSTTEIIRYIQDYIPRNRLLIVCDRDGTLIADAGFPGKSPDWKSRLQLNREVAAFLAYLSAKFETTVIGVTNQSGVARGYFTEATVREVNDEINRQLQAFRVNVARWEYCPDVDEKYAAGHPEIAWNHAYVREKTRRKPSGAMVDDALRALGVKVTDFRMTLVLGNSEDDRLLARNLSSLYLDVSGKKLDNLVSEFGIILK
jgi:rfaE bifunctional protein nucleotidyltransferase chain/domain